MASSPTVIHGECIEEMFWMDEASVDAVVTDPPYALEFMGKGWDQFRDGSYQHWTEQWAREVMRVLRPGGHLLAFGGTRTWHRLAAGIEDAGFEIRDSIAWMYGSGFPKSMDVSKAIDKAAGAAREIVGTRTSAYGSDTATGERASRDGGGAGLWGGGDAREVPLTGGPATDDAAAWTGWGTALKPAFEPVVVARKPLGERTVAANVLAYGTGALNIDGTRLGGEPSPSVQRRESAVRSDWDNRGGAIMDDRTSPERYMEARHGEQLGRWPANVALGHTEFCEVVGVASERVGGGAAASGGMFQDGYERGDGFVGRDVESEVWRCTIGCPVRMLDEQAPATGAAARASGPTRTGGSKSDSMAGAFNGTPEQAKFHADLGGASRFMYVAKAPKSERPVVDGVAHPTVKPLALMRWLLRLVTPPGGTVLDPFAGSGATVEAAMQEGIDIVAIERETEYLPLIAARIERQTRAAA